MELEENATFAVGAYAGKTQRIVYRHQQVETMKCKSDILQKNLFFKSIICNNSI